MECGLNDLTDDVLRLIVLKLAPKHTFRLMACNRRFRALGLQSACWTTWGSMLGLHKPTRYARVYKHAYQIYIKHACKACFSRRAHMLSLCHTCYIRPEYGEARVLHARWARCRRVRQETQVRAREARHALKAAQADVHRSEILHIQSVQRMAAAKREYVAACQRQCLS